MHKVTEMVGSGDILMIDRAGDMRYAALGGVVSHALRVRKVEAVIMDGAVTDINEIREMGLLRCLPPSCTYNNKAFRTGRRDKHYY